MFYLWFTKFTLSVSAFGRKDLDGDDGPADVPIGGEGVFDKSGGETFPPPLLNPKFILCVSNLIGSIGLLAPKFNCKQIKIRSEFSKHRVKFLSCKGLSSYDDQDSNMESRLPTWSYWTGFVNVFSM